MDQALRIMARHIYEALLLILISAIIVMQMRLATEQAQASQRKQQFLDTSLVPKKQRLRRRFDNANVSFERQIDSRVFVSVFT